MDTLPSKFGIPLKRLGLWVSARSLQLLFGTSRWSHSADRAVKLTFAPGTAFHRDFAYVLSSLELSMTPRHSM